MDHVTRASQCRPTDRFDFATTDLDELQEVIRRLLLPRFPAPVVHGRPGARHQAWLQYRHAGHLSFASIFYDQDVWIDAGAVDDCFFLQVPETVGFQGCAGGDLVDYPIGSAQIANPGRPIALRWRGGCRALLLRQDRCSLHEHLALLVQNERTLRFPDKLSLCAPSGASLARFLRLLRDEIDRDSSLLSTALARRHAEHMLVALLLAAAGLLDEPAAPAPCSYVRRAQAFVHANLAEPIGLSDIVAASGVSVRSLYAGFRRDIGCPPMNYVKLLRLDRAHADLLDADPATTRVTDVAAEWGFLHFGRFAADYRARFGEKPSETLRKAQ